MKVMRFLGLRSRPAGRLAGSLASVIGLGLMAGCDLSGRLIGPPGSTIPLSAVVVSPTADTLKTGQTVQFTAQAFDTAGAPTSMVNFQWSSGDPNVFTVDGTGKVRGIGEGLAMLRVTASDKSDSALVFVYPDTGWFAQVSNANGANLNGVFFLADGRRGWAVGDAGKILATADAGETWLPQTSFTFFSLHAVWFTSATNGFAVGNSGTIMRTTNGGGSWTRLTISASENLMDIHFSDALNGWVVGGTGVTLRTIDGGASWQRVNAPTASTLNSVSFAGLLHGWAAGEGGVIAGTHDGGTTWFVVTPFVTNSALRGVSRRSEPMAVAAGAQGVTPRTIVTPDSTAWQLANVGAAFQLEGIHFPADLIGYAVGFNSSVGGAVLRSQDGGVTWQAQASHTNFRLNDVFFVDELRGWAVGQGGTILHTARGGGQ